MKIERTKNATKNIVFGVALRIYQIIVPFLMRTAMIYCLGVEYLGLSSLFTSILQVLNLAELGIGSAMIFSMYKPITENDADTICALMKLYKVYYRIIGIFVLVVGMILCPFLPYLIKENVPTNVNLYILYLLNLMATVLSYWLFAYKNSLLQAHQRNDIISKITLIISTIQYMLQFLTIFLFKNYYFYVIILLLSQVAINIVTAIIANKMYPSYHAKGKLDKESIKKINKRVRDLFTSKIGGVIVNSVNTIVISSFLGLKVLAIYQNYYFILTSIMGIVGVIFTSCTAGIGNSIILETKEKNYKDLRKFTFIVWVISIFCVCELLCLCQPFMEWWVGKDLLLEFPIVICLCLYYIIYEENMLMCTYKDAAGIWHTDRFRPLITAILNLILDLVLVNIMGIYGVMIATVISIGIVGFPWILHNVFKEIFKIGIKQYLKELLEYFIVLVFIAFVSYIITSVIVGSTLFIIIIKGIICFAVVSILLFVIFRKKDVFIDMKELVKKMLKIK